MRGSCLALHDAARPCSVVFKVIPFASTSSSDDSDDTSFPIETRDGEEPFCLCLRANAAKGWASGFFWPLFEVLLQVPDVGHFAFV